mgnify:CR=1 FL=1
MERRTAVAHKEGSHGLKKKLELALDELTEHEAMKDALADGIKCWACDEYMTLNTHAENDGHCIHCQAGIQLGNSTAVNLFNSAMGTP